MDKDDRAIIAWITLFLIGCQVLLGFLWLGQENTEPLLITDASFDEYITELFINGRYQNTTFFRLTLTHPDGTQTIQDRKHLLWCLMSLWVLVVLLWILFDGMIFLRPSCPDCKKRSWWWGVCAPCHAKREADLTKRAHENTQREKTMKDLWIGVIPSEKKENEANRIQTLEEQVTDLWKRLEAIYKTLETKQEVTIPETTEEDPCPEKCLGKDCCHRCATKPVCKFFPKHEDFLIHKGRCDDWKPIPTKEKFCENCGLLLKDKVCPTCYPEGSI